MDRNTLKPIIYTGLFLVPFIPFLVSSSFFFPFITTKAFTWRIIIEIVFAAWVLLALMEPEYRPRKSLILYAIGAFLLIIGLADIFGAAPVKSFWSNYERMEGYITLLHLGAFFLVIGSVFKEIDWKRWWNVSLVASFIMVIYSAFQLSGSIQIHQGGVRVDGTLGNATYLAVYMLFHIFVALFFMWRERGMSRFMYGALIALQTWILYQTATRGAILGLLGGLLIMALLSLKSEVRRVRRASMVMLLVLILSIGGFFALRESSIVKNSPVLSRFASISTEELKSGGRAFVWPMAIEGMKERPILGWGQDNFNYVFNGHYDPAMYKLEPWFDRAHNIFLDWGIAGGILGLLSYLSLYGMLLYLLWRKSTFSYEERSIVTGLVAAYFFHNFFVFDQLISYILFFALLAHVHSRDGLGLAAAQRVSADVKRDAQRRRITQVAMPIAAVLLLAVLYFANIRPMQANTSLIQALQSLSSGNVPLITENFQKAYASSRLGRPEAVEQIAAYAVPILSSQAPVEERNIFFNFAKGAVVSQAEEFPDDARYQFIAGIFFSSVSSLDEGLDYLTRAASLMPGKQSIHLEIAKAYLAKGDKGKAIETLRHIIEISPDHRAEMEEYIRQIQAAK
jgi:O-antigen ligase